MDFNVTGVDYSTKCLNICREINPNLNLFQSDIRKFNIEKDKYDLILSTYVLHFLHKDDSYNIIKSMKENLRINGLIYICVFSKEDPKFNKHLNSNDMELLDNNIFHNKINDTYISFFTKDEILALFEGFKALYISQEYSLEQNNDSPHYAGIIKYIGMKM